MFLTFYLWQWIIISVYLVTIQTQVFPKSNRGKVLTSVNAIRLQPGDSVWFHANQTFKGNLTLSDTDTDASDKPITFSSYGDGRATIDASIGHGFFIQNRGGVQITNLNFVGIGADQNTSSGIMVRQYTAGTQKTDAYTH